MWIQATTGASVPGVQSGSSPLCLFTQHKHTPHTPHKPQLESLPLTSEQFSVSPPRDVR